MAEEVFAPSFLILVRMLRQGQTKCRSPSVLTDRLHLVRVPDSTTEAIDRFFDLVDNGVETIDHALNRGKHVEGQQRARRQRREVIDAASAEVIEKRPVAKDAASPSSSALARKPHFYVVESIMPTGTIFVVTDGGNARTECSSREFAEKILRALEATP